MTDTKFSVLLAVYYKEKPEYLIRAIESIYFDQELKPHEIVLVEDGPLTDELYLAITDLRDRIGEKIFKPVSLEKNSGLGIALQKGVEACSHEIIARMDTDDIAYKERFSLQMDYLSNHPEIDVLGAFMSEFIDDIEHIICLKKVPVDTKSIQSYIRMRNPINHPTVVFKKSKVLSVGNYQDCYFNEDYYLWGRMVAKGYQIANIPQPLVYFRTTNDTYKRRGGLQYIQAEYGLQRQFLRLGIINTIDFLRNILLKSMVRLMPNSLRKWIYMNFLRR